MSTSGGSESAASVRSPLLLSSSSRALQMDNALTSNAYEEPLQSISVMQPDILGSDRFRPVISPDKEPVGSPNQAPRYRATPRDGRQFAGRKRLHNEKHPPLHRRISLYHSDSKSPSPFRSNAKQQSFLQFFPTPYLFNQIKLPSLARPHNFRDSQLFWLGLYFAFNLGLTLFNKGVLLRFPFPYTLTALHALCGSIGGYVLLENGVFVPARLGTRETVALVAFSMLYAINIVVSNMSLHLVTVPVRCRILNDLLRY